MLANEIANIPLRIKNKKTGGFTELPALERLLATPNAKTTCDEFVTATASDRNITGNYYFHATSKGGNPNSEILELSLLRPQRVTAITDGDANVLRYQLSTTGRFGKVFEAFEDKNGIRYFDADGNELWHAKLYNPNISPLGLPPSTPLQFELIQFIEASKHNTAFFKNGATPGGMLIPDPDLTADEKDRLRLLFEEKFTSSKNNARWVFGSGLKDLKSFGTSAKDMDFVNMRKELKRSIYSMFNIPLGLVDIDAMKFKNVETGRLALYDNAVLPIMDNILCELTAFVMHRYADPETFEISYNKKDIPALETRFLEQAKMRREIGVESADELREVIGLEESGQEGADELLVLRESAMTAGEDEPDDKKEEPSDDKKEFFKSMAHLEEGYLKQVADDAEL
jgi:HK97 family phage portal protein